MERGGEIWLSHKSACPVAQVLSVTTATEAGGRLELSVDGRSKIYVANQSAVVDASSLALLPYGEDRASLLVLYEVRDQTQRVLREARNLAVDQDLEDLYGRRGGMCKMMHFCRLTPGASCNCMGIRVRRWQPFTSMMFVRSSADWICST